MNYAVSMQLFSWPTKVIEFSYLNIKSTIKGLPATEDNMKKIIDSSANKVEAQWLKLFAKALKDMNVNTLFTASAAPATAVGSSSAPVEKK